MKKFCYLIIGFLLVVSGVFALIRLRKQPVGPVQKASREKAALPLFPQSATSERFSYLLRITPPAIPTALPTYNTVPLVVPDEAVRVARSLSLLGNAKILSGATKTSYLWSSSDGASLEIFGDPIRIEYTRSPSSSSQLSLPIDRYIAEAQTTLSRLLVPARPLSLTLLSPRYYTRSGDNLIEQGSWVGASVVEVRFDYSLAGFPALFGSPTAPGASVFLAADASVIRLEATIPPNVLPSGTSTPVLDPETAALRLENGGVVISFAAEGDRWSFPERQLSVSSVTTSSLILGYYYNGGQAALVPVYLFSSKGTDALTGELVNVVTGVSALP